MNSVCFPGRESPPKAGSTLDGKNFLLGEQILSFPQARFFFFFFLRVYLAERLV